MPARAEHRLQEKHNDTVLSVSHLQGCQQPQPGLVKALGCRLMRRRAGHGPRQAQHLPKHSRVQPNRADALERNAASSDLAHVPCPGDAGIRLLRLLSICICNRLGGHAA